MISHLLGIEHPFIQAPMAGVQDATLAAAISNAGGLGSLPCAMLSPAALEAELQRLNSMTANPHNLNFFCHSPVEPTTAQLQCWRETLAPYYRELDIDPGIAPSQAKREPFNATSLEIIREYRPAVVSFHFGLPRKEWLEEIKRWGTTILSTATTVEEARWLASHGADAVIAQGIEAGGHRGCFLTSDMATQCSTTDLLRDIRQAVTLPVIAAGGIGNPAAVAAALVSGADGVQVGTCFLLCPECTTTPLHRAALSGELAASTELTNVFTGRPARGINNRLIRDIGPMSDDAPPFPSAAGALAPLRQAAEAIERTDFSPLWSGTDASGCRELPAAQMLAWLTGELD